MANSHLSNPPFKSFVVAAAQRKATAERIRNHLAVSVTLENGTSVTVGENRLAENGGSLFLYLREAVIQLVQQPDGSFLLSIVTTPDTHVRQDRPAAPFDAVDKSLPLPPAGQMDPGQEEDEEQAQRFEPW